MSAMEGVEGEISSSRAYTLQPTRFCNEDILFCIDVDLESQVEMKVTGPKGRPFTRLDSIKQAILLFVNAKLTINPEHRFAFAALGRSASWLRKEFSSEVDSVIAALRMLSADTSYGHADLTQLFRVAAHEAKKSRSQNRIFRLKLIKHTSETLVEAIDLGFISWAAQGAVTLKVSPPLSLLDHFRLESSMGVNQNIDEIYDFLERREEFNSLYSWCGKHKLHNNIDIGWKNLYRERRILHSHGLTSSQILIYCRSSVQPQYQWPANQKLFTLDVIYLHDKPVPENCPQKVYDALVDALEHVSEYEGYIFESGQGLARVLFRHMCVLLSHPQQRCVQDDIDIPKSLAKKSLATDSTPGEENVAVSSQ